VIDIPGASQLHAGELGYFTVIYLIRFVSFHSD
jgi:hypothetical protein